MSEAELLAHGFVAFDAGPHPAASAEHAEKASVQASAVTQPYKPSAAAESLPGLSPREREVVGLLAQGNVVESVARLTNLKVTTVQQYLHRARLKYDAVDRPARTRIDLYKRAVEDNLIPASATSPAVTTPSRASASRPLSEATVQAAVSGDRMATDRLLRELRPLVVKYCRARIGRSATTADDVAQDVCLAVLTALPNYRDQGRPFLAFVYGIAAHKVADAHRALARNRDEPVATLPEQAETAAGPEQYVVGDGSGQLIELLHRLPPRQREVLVLRVVVGLSSDEVSEALKMSRRTVQNLQVRALENMRSYVANEADLFL